MKSKYEAINHIKKIMEKYHIEISELQGITETKPQTQTSILMQLTAYLGAIFILCGIAAYVVMFWEEMNTFTHTLVTLGSGLVAYCLALIAMNDLKFQKMVTPLFILAAILEPTGLFVFLHDYFQTSTAWQYSALFVFGTMFIQQICTFIAKDRMVLLFTSLIFGIAFLATLFDLLGLAPELNATVLGLSILLLCYSFEKLPYKDLVPFWYFIGGIAFMLGLFEWLRNSVLELFVLGAGAFLIYISTVVKSRTLLFVSTISIFCYIGYFTKEHFFQSIGWPISLILLGFILFGLSAFAFKINQKYLKQ